LGRRKRGRRKRTPRKRTPTWVKEKGKSLSGKSSAAICKRFLEHGDTDHILGSPSQDLEILAEP
jgi:hypothetical protein